MICISKFIEEISNTDNIKEIISMWLQTNKQNLEETEINLIAKRLFGFTRSEILIMLNLSYIKYEIAYNKCYY